MIRISQSSQRAWGPTRSGSKARGVCLGLQVWVGCLVGEAQKVLLQLCLWWQGCAFPHLKKSVIPINRKGKVAYKNESWKELCWYQKLLGQILFYSYVRVTIVVRVVVKHKLLWKSWFEIKLFNVIKMIALIQYFKICIRYYYSNAPWK